MISARRIAPVLVLAAAACSSSPGASASKTGADDGGATEAGSSSGGDAGTTGCPDGCADGGPSHSDSGATAADAGSHDGATPGDGAADGDGAAAGDGAMPGDGAAADGGSTTGTLPVLSHASANQSGRDGTDLYVTVSGTDVNESAYALDIQLLDASNSPVAGFHAMGSSPGSAERVALFDGASAVGKASFTATVTLPGILGSYASIASVTVAIVDGAGTSNAKTAAVTKQTLASLTQACDPKVVTSRCPTGDWCDPAAKVCKAAAVPQLARFAYVPSPQGARMLFAGADDADDLSSIHLQFLDLNKQPVLVDLTGNMDFQSSMDIAVYGASTLSAFFHEVPTAPSFPMAVPRLVATPTGDYTGAGSPVTATLAAAPVAASGAACDPRGFVVCGSGESCVGSVCMATTAALAAAFQAAAVVDGASHPLATGYADGPGLWGDPPAGCAPTGAHDLPEGIVTLHVAQDTPSLTITTDNQETTMRAALFVLPGTGAQVGSQPLGCVSGLPATVPLTNVPAGDYTVVVAALLPGAGNFGVSVR